MPYCQNFHAKCGGATILTVTHCFSLWGYRLKSSACVVEPHSFMPESQTARIPTSHFHTVGRRLNIQECGAATQLAAQLIIPIAKARGYHKGCGSATLLHEKLYYIGAYCKNTVRD